jgi:hypothetical protein
LLSGTLALSASQLNPQESCDIPVVVSRYDNSLVEDLKPDDFKFEIGADKGTVTSAVIDRGPKWVALILDASRNIPDDEWKMQVEMAANLLGHARLGDRFFFMVLETDIAPVDSLEAAAVKERLAKLAMSRPAATDSNEKIYDALLLASNEHKPSQFGDTIFLFGHHEDFGSLADPDEILGVMLRKRLRFFGMSYADLFRNLPRGFDINKPLPPEMRPKKLEQMSMATGNYFSFHQLVALRQPGQMELYESFLGDLYLRIAEPYRVRITMTSIKGPQALHLAVSNMQERKVRDNSMYYPRTIYPCSGDLKN